MKKITFKKYSNNVNLLHLYEHVVCNKLREYLFSKGYFGYIDYFLSGRTYDYGWTSIEFEIHNYELLDIIENINNIPFEFSKRDVNNAYLSMMAEEKCHFGISSESIDFYEEINKLNKAPWVDGNIYKKTDIKNDEILLREDDCIKTKEYEFEIIINPGHTSEKKLREIVARSIQYNVWQMLSVKRGYYVDDPRIDNNTLYVKADVLDDMEVDLEKDKKYILSILDKMIKSGAFERMQKMLIKGRVISDRTDIMPIVNDFSFSLKYDGAVI